MQMSRARELIQEQVGFTSGYNRNSVRLVLAEVQKVHGQAAVDQLIDEFNLEEHFGLAKGTDFSRIWQ